MGKGARPAGLAVARARRSPAGAPHGRGLDLDQHAVAGEIGQRHGGDRRRRAVGQRRPDAGQEFVLVDTAIVRVEGGQHDHVGKVGAEALEHPAHGGHHLARLGRQVTGVAHTSRRIEVDLAADEDHLAATQAMLVRQVDRPVPVPRGP